MCYMTGHEVLELWLMWIFKPEEKSCMHLVMWEKRQKGRIEVLGHKGTGGKKYGYRRF